VLSNQTNTNLGLADVNVIIHELQQTLDVAPVFAKILAISFNTRWKKANSSGYMGIQPRRMPIVTHH
jgi:hypothetical protein